MTKPVTAVAMMMLHEEGRWRPTDPIGKHLPGFDDAAGLSPARRSEGLLLEPADHAPTIGALLTHTAGFTYGFDPADPLTPFYRAADSGAARSLAEFAARVSTACRSPISPARSGSTASPWTSRARSSRR